MVGAGAGAGAVGNMGADSAAGYAVGLPFTLWSESPNASLGSESFPAPTSATVAASVPTVFLDLAGVAASASVAVSFPTVPDLVGVAGGATEERRLPRPFCQNV